MRKILFIVISFLSLSAYGQLDTVDFSIYDFWIPSRPGSPDFVRTEFYKINQSIRNIDSLNNFIDVTDSSAVMTTLVVDSIAAGAITYTDTYYDDLRVPLTNTQLTPTKSEPVFEDMGNGFLAHGFDADADSTEYLHFIAQMPHSWSIGTDVDVHIHWSPATTNTGDVIWKLKYSVGEIGAAFSAADSFYITDAGDGTALLHQYLDLGDIPGATIGTGVSSIIMGQLCRVGEDAADTFTGTAYGIEIDFHYQIDAPGSDQETTK